MPAVIFLACLDLERKSSLINRLIDNVMDKYDIIIIGAGINALSLAHYCARTGFKTLVIEKSERVGGTFYSHHIKDEAKGFWLELGAHTCYNSYHNLIGIIEDCRILDRLVQRKKFLLGCVSGIR